MLKLLLKLKIKMLMKIRLIFVKILFTLSDKKCFILLLYERDFHSLTFLVPLFIAYPCKSLSQEKELEKETLGQFHQHFTRGYFADILAPKSHKVKTLIEKICPKHFGMKNVHAKC